MEKIKVFVEEGINVNERSSRTWDSEPYEIIEGIPKVGYMCRHDDKPYIIIVSKLTLKLLRSLQGNNSRRPIAIGLVGEEGGTVYLDKNIFLLGDRNVKEILFWMRQKDWWDVGESSFMSNFNKGGD